MKRLLALLLALCLVTCLFAGCTKDEPSTDDSKESVNNSANNDPANDPANNGDDDEYHIGFVVHTTSGDVMSAIEYGAKAAAEDYGVKLTYTGPVDSDNTQQISMFESLVAAGCDAIVIIAGDSTVWDEPIAAAVEKGVTVVITDSDAPTSQRATYFGVNTAKLAYDLGTAVREQAGDEGTVALGVCVLGPESHTTRANQVMAAYDGANVKFTEVFETDLDTTLNYNNWENILTSNSDLTAMVGLSAIETTNMGKVAKNSDSSVVMGAYDPGTEALNLLKEGWLDVCAFQNVWLEGYLPVQALARMLKEGRQLNPEDNLYDGQIVTSSEVTDELMERAASEDNMNAWYRKYIADNGLEEFGLLPLEN